MYASIFGDVVVNATLYVEHAVLEICNVKEAARRLSDLAERHEEKNADHADGLPGDPLQPLIRAYCTLRHANCREQRWRLLSRATLR